MACYMGQVNLSKETVRLQDKVEKFIKILDSNEEPIAETEEDAKAIAYAKKIIRDRRAFLSAGNKEDKLNTPIIITGVLIAGILIFTLTRRQ